MFKKLEVIRSFQEQHFFLFSQTPASEAQSICQGRRVKNTARAKRAQEIFYPESETPLYKCGVRSYLCAGK